MIEQTLHSILHFYPEIALIVTLCALILADLILKKGHKASGWILLSGILVTGFLLLQHSGESTTVFYDMIAIDPFGLFFKIVILLSAVFIIFFTMKSVELQQHADRIGEYYMLITGMILGMFLMVSSTNLLMIYLAFEITSICSYVLSGFTRRSLKSAEGSMKFILFGAVSSGILLYGISLLVGITGSTDIYGVHQALSTGITQPVLLSLSVLMVIAGMGFKLALVPFHFWAPDVYEGAPTPITAFLAVASKIAAVGMTLRFFLLSFTESNTGSWAIMEGMNWDILLGVMAALAMILGNLTALRQDNIKRMLAYSSIAHAGYIMMGFVVLSREGLSAVLIYVFMYLFMNLGAFFVAMLFSDRLKSASIESFKGMGFRAPLESVALTIFLIALTGIPPTAGFIAKLYIFGAAISAGWIWLVAIAGITTVVSLFYYVRVVRNMYFYKPEQDSDPITFDWSSKAILMLLVVPTLILGVYFTQVLEFARNSIELFGM